MAENGAQFTTERWPSPGDAGNSITRNGFKVTTRKLPILKAEPIEKMTEALGIAVPEMIFGDNVVTVEHPQSSFGISFNTFDALDRVDKTGNSMLQVAHSKEWQSTREKKHEGITEVVKPFDWSYSTDYKGTLKPGSPQFAPSQTPIPLELLKRPDPILFFDEVMLYEDEMADNGITMLSCKVRVMPERMLLLCRFFMRLDNVVVRVRDTRLYIDFSKREIIREYQAKEEKYETVRQKLSSAGQDAPAQLRDPNKMAELIPIVKKTLEQLVIRSNSAKAARNCGGRKSMTPIDCSSLTNKNDPSFLSWTNARKGFTRAMSSRYVCSNCRQTLRLRLRQALQNHAQSREWISTHANRPLSTVRILQAAQPQPYQKPSTSSASTATPSSDPKTYPKTPEPSPGSSFSPAQSIARELRKRAGVTTETYVAYGVCETLVKECARQAAYKIPQAQQKNTDIPKTKDGEDLGVGDGSWYQTLGLTPTFTTWAQVTFLHMYMLTCRLRMFPPAYAPTWHQHLLDHFFFMAEDRMVTQHGIVAGSIRSKYLKDLFVQWRGLTAGYDEGLIKGDAVLATAVWRNLFKADSEVDYRGVGQVVSYVRGVLQGLDGIEDEDIARGEVVFGDPGREKDYVLGKSRMMNMLPESKPKAEI